jgi:hypothetical protein
MQNRNQSLTVAAIISSLAGAITIGFMAAQFTGIDSTNVLGTCCMHLVVAVLFFALAGGFKENGQWSISMMEFMCFVVIAIVLFAAITEIFNVFAAIALIAMAAVVLISVLVSLKSETYFGA